MSVREEISNFIENQPKGSIFFPQDFKAFGTSEAIRIAFYRMVKNKEIMRYDQGIYYRPEEDSIIGKVRPSLREVAYAIAKRDKSRIIPTGASALNLLGLSPQVPTKEVYLTDGSPRKILINRSILLFKRTSTKNLSYKGELTSLVVQALKAIGKDNITDDIENKVIQFLKKEDQATVLEDSVLAPNWITKIFRKAIE